MLSQSRHEMHVPLSEGIHVVCHRSGVPVQTYQTAKNEEKSSAHSED
jgi:hypothetical protein